MWHLNDPLAFLPQSIDGLYNKLDLLFRFQSTQWADVFCMQPYMDNEKLSPLVFKIIRPFLMNNSLAISMLKNEAEKSLLIDHPRFLKIRGLTKLYIIYDWIDGSPLNERKEVHQILLGGPPTRRGDSE